MSKPGSGSAASAAATDRAGLDRAGAQAVSSNAGISATSAARCFARTAWAARRGRRAIIGHQAYSPTGVHVLPPSVVWRSSRFTPVGSHAGWVGGNSCGPQSGRAQPTSGDAKLDEPMLKANEPTTVLQCAPPSTVDATEDPSPAMRTHSLAERNCALRPSCGVLKRGRRKRHHAVRRQCHDRPSSPLV